MQKCMESPKQARWRRTHRAMYSFRRCIRFLVRSCSNEIDMFSDKNIMQISVSVLLHPITCPVVYIRKAETTLHYVMSDTNSSLAGR